MVKARIIITFKPRRLSDVLFLAWKQAINTNSVQHYSNSGDQIIIEYSNILVSFTVT